MATKLVRVLATEELSCGHPAHASTTRVGPTVGTVHCSLCALASIDALTAEIAHLSAARASRKD